MTQINMESCDSLPPDEEPKLKYDRMANDVEKILLKDAVSCISVHPKFICLGTQYGTVHILDHEGNTVSIGTQNIGENKELRAHTIAVNQISVDRNGEFIATCSDDGKVFIYGLYSSENNYNISLGRVIKSISLDPDYFKSGSGRRFLIGDSKLTLYENTFLNRIRSSVLCECEGYVEAISWQDRFVALTSIAGVRVYDLVARCSLGLITWETNKNKSVKGFRCNLLWASDRLLMIGWIDTVRICLIRKRTSLEISNKDAPEYLVDPMYTFQTDYYISGLGPLDNQLVILGFPKEKDAKTLKSQRPILCVADYKDCEFAEVSTDQLNIKGYEEYNCNDYHLAILMEENRFFIVSPKDIFVASPYDTDDKVQWHINNGRHEKAIAILEESNCKSNKHSVVQIGILYIDHLLTEKDFDKAAKLCIKVCANNKDLWEEQIYKFCDANQLRIISTYIPKTIEFKLSPNVYEMVLNEFLQLDPAGFLKLVQDWNPSLYKTNVVINAVIKHILITNENKEIYLESLAVLYCNQKTYDKALAIYLNLKHKDVFSLIKRHKMYNAVHDKILALMTLDSEKAISILLDKIKIPPEVIEKQLENNDQFLYLYLDAYSKIEPNGKYHGKLVSLYSQYAREKLLPFLKSSDNYPIQAALDICKAKNFYQEMVYLLGRIGNTKEALKILIEKLCDINKAVQFCQEHNDQELWLDLINHSLENQEYISILLKRIGNYIDPRILIQDIKPNCEIKDLKESLCKLMSDYKIQLSVQEACKAITYQNYFDLHEKLVQGHIRGTCVSDDFLCSDCGFKIIGKDLDLVVYNCRHIFHIKCAQFLEYCSVCNNFKS